MISAIEAYSTADSSAAAPGASVRSSAAAAGAGTATATASACSTSSPATSRQPSSGSRRSSVTGVPVRMRAPRERRESATASGRDPTPPATPMKTGPVCWAAAVFAWTARTASVREGWTRAASKSAGTAERMEMR